MSAIDTSPMTRLLASRVLIPDHVVHREFPSETVVLNLGTGQYHGLNPVAGRMLRVLEQAASIGEAVGALQAEFPAAAGRIESDVEMLCQELAGRGLVTIAPPQGG